MSRLMKILFPREYKKLQRELNETKDVVSNNGFIEKKIYQFLSESSDGYCGYWDWHMDSSIPLEENYEYMSPRFWEIFGYEAHEKEHKAGAWMDLIFEEDGKVAIENLEKHIETKGKHPYTQTVRYRHKDGSTVVVLCKGSVIEWNKDGSPKRMVGTHSDITKEFNK